MGGQVGGLEQQWGGSGGWEGAEVGGICCRPRMLFDDILSLGVGRS